jgi:hypothetical protein
MATSSDCSECRFDGADINAQGGQFGNALQATSFRGRTEIVQDKGNSIWGLHV